MKFYPLKFEPILKERLWGGTKLGEVLHKKIPNDITGESWELSAVEGDVSIVANGPWKGTSLQSLIDEHQDSLLGRSVFDRFGTEFPILIKFIDAKKDLSIQLHPNDELAQKRHGSFGKTEMWYIMDDDPGAELIVGFNKEVEKTEYQERVENGSLLDILNYEEVAEGDTFFINTGKIHAIGAGVLLAEIQQTSDITYRVFDFNRKDKNGNLRELHTELALDAIDYSKKDDFKVSYPQAENATNPMVECPYFKTDYLNLDRDFEQDLASRDSFTIYLCVKGKARFKSEGGEADLVKGETLLIPAATEPLRIETDGARLLEVTI